MPDLSNIDFKICIPMGLVILLFILIAFGRPRDTTWIEHCPHCNAELGSKFKGEKPYHCKECGHDIYFTKPHASK